MSRSRQVRPWQPTSSRWFVVVARLLRPVLVLLTIRRWQGVENIPAQGGVIIAVNHISVVDPLTVAHLLLDHGRIPRFMAKSELFGWPAVGAVMRLTGQIPVRRDSPDAALALGDAVRALEAGECVVIYPEGTVTKSRDLWPMAARSGVARLAALSGAPVVPVAQWGAHRILGRDRRLRLLPRHTISILVGPAVDLDIDGEGSSMEVLRQATDEVMATITRQLEALRGEVAPRTAVGPA